MRTIDINEAQAKLSELIDQASDDEEIVIQRAGVPVAKLVRLDREPERSGQRVLGLLRGKLKVPEDFDDPLPDDVLASFEGR